MVRPGTEADLEGWMALVAAVAGDFPGMDLGEHRQTVLGFLARGEALCAVEGNRILGVLLFSSAENQICCLGVDPDHRRRGIAGALLQAAIGAMDPTRPITVTTYREGGEKAAAARSLYRKYGFSEGALTEEFGTPCQIFIRDHTDFQQERLRT